MIKHFLISFLLHIICIALFFFIKTPELSLLQKPNESQAISVSVVYQHHTKSDKASKTKQLDSKKESKLKNQHVVFDKNHYKKATVTKNYPPVYPEIARQLRQEGKVLLKVFVSKEGVPTKIDVLLSSGHYLLDQAAVRSIKAWRFEPAKMLNKSVASTLEVPVQFSLI